MLYTLDQNVVPNWFGVAIADGCTDFTRPTIYFHPNPQPAGYEHGGGNSIYFGKSDPDALGLTPLQSEQRRKWHQLFEYVDRLAAQLAGAVALGANPNQILILPFMPASAIGDAGKLPQHWHPIVTDILGDVRQAMTGVGGALTVTDVVVAGYSFGYQWSKTFRNLANQALIGPLLKQVWDFDGFPKPTGLVTVPGTLKAIKYSESPATESLALPKPRWDDYPDPPPDEEPGLPGHGDVHHFIRDFMFLDAALKRDLVA